MSKASKSVFKILRDYLGLTQQELANKNGWSKSYICEIENNKKNVTIKILNLYGSALGINASDVLALNEIFFHKKDIVFSTDLGLMKNFIEIRLDKEGDYGSS